MFRLHIRSNGWKTWNVNSIMKAHIGFLRFWNVCSNICSRRGLRSREILIIRFLWGSMYSIWRRSYQIQNSYFKCIKTTFIANINNSQFKEGASVNVVRNAPSKKLLLLSLLTLFCRFGLVCSGNYIVTLMSMLRKFFKKTKARPKKSVYTWSIWHPFSWKLK